MGPNLTGVLKGDKVQTETGIGEEDERKREKAKDLRAWHRSSLSWSSGRESALPAP